MTNLFIVRESVRLGYGKDYGRRLIRATKRHPKRHCSHCRNQLLVEVEVGDYPYYCIRCDENMFEFEAIA